MLVWLILYDKLINYMLYNVILNRVWCVYADRLPDYYYYYYYYLFLTTIITTIIITITTTIIITITFTLAFTTWRTIIWEDRFYTPPPHGSDFCDCDCVELRQKLLYTTPSGWWWWCIESGFRLSLLLHLHLHLLHVI